MPTPQPQLEVGSYYGKYFLLKKLAAGGMGEIFLAKQQGPAGFEKILVVKKVLPHLTENKEFVELFLSEARLAARMNHRNVVQLFELGEHQGSYFIAMEYVSGRTLRDLIDAAARKKEKIPAEVCRTIAEQICDGASYAHNLTDVTGRSLNIIHRDLNPQNVLLSYTGDVKIIDFGIAKSEMSTVKTEAGMIKGKFVYMSPEQSLAKKLDKRSDVFAIGISLYEMLTGTNPFHKSNIVLTLEAVQRYDPPPPSEYDASYAPFDPIVAKALVKDRDRRYPDAAEMLDDLRRIVVPRSPERLGQLMARLFRQQLEEEQRLLLDTDGGRAAPGGSARPSATRTPARILPTPVAKPETDGGGGTLILNPAIAPGAKKAATPPQPSAAPGTKRPTTPPGGVRPPAKPAAPPPRPVGAADTLLDAGVSSLAPHDDVPGGTAMLRPGQALPTPPPRKAARPTDTMPDIPEVTEPALPLEGRDGKTAFFGTAPARPARKPPPPSNGGETSILSPEEAQASAREAMAKLQQAQQQVLRTNTRPQGPGEAARKGSGRGPWIALGAGVLVALAGVVALLVWLLSDEPVASHPRRAVAAIVSEAPKEDRGGAADKGAGSEPSQAVERKRRIDESREQKKPAPKPAPVEKVEAAPRKIGAGKLFGTLTVNPQGGAPITFAGSAQPKQIGAYNLPVTGDTGTVEVGDSSSPYKVQLEYVRSGSALNVKVSTSPWAIVWVDGTSRGRAPVSGVKLEPRQTLLELKKPGEDSGMLVKLQYRPN
ncbi:MAG: protein kinase domain-containing protein [Myxococcales bacterium]